MRRISAAVAFAGVNNPVGGIVFRVPVTDRRNGEKKQYSLHCFFAQPIPANDPRTAELAVGRAVALKGQTSGVNIGSPSASLGQCSFGGTVANIGAAHAAQQNIGAAHAAQRSKRRAASMTDPLAYFITFSCYGSWLHGDERGSVDDSHNAWGTPVLTADAERHVQVQGRLREPPYHLDAPRRRATLHAVCEIANRKRWKLHAVHIRPSHVHIVVTANGSPERVMNDFKTAASRRLNKAYPDEDGRTRWTRHGSTRYLWTEEAVAQKVRYVLEDQGEPMERYPDRSRARSAAE